MKITPPKTIAVKLNAKAERHVKKGHPWIFSDSIIKESKEPETGDVAIVFDSMKNKYLALGLYDCNSPIRIKVVRAHDKIKLDAAYLRSALQERRAIRKPLLEKDVTAYRWLNGENDHFPGIILDVYGTTAVLKLYTLAWMPYLEDIIAIIPEISDVSCIVLRSARNIADTLSSEYDLPEGKILYGSLEDPIVHFTEYGVTFSADVIKGHKTGYFLDHRHNRHTVGQLSKGKKVLDIFSYAGGFSVHALVGGATEVTSVDISTHALAMASANAKLNTTTGKHHTIAGDAFEVMASLIESRKTFDIVVVDPPSFAKQNSEIPKAISSYQKLATLAIDLVAEGGTLVMASCSSRVDKDTFFDTIEDIILDHPDYKADQKKYHDTDHPIAFPEGAYLKTGYYQRNA